MLCLMTASSHSTTERFGEQMPQCLSEGGRGWRVGPSSFQAAAPLAWGATVTSHLGDILKGASQQGAEVGVCRCRGSVSMVK